MLSPTAKENWNVIVYDEQNRVVETWTINDRTQREAFDEAVADIFKLKNYFDWTLRAARATETNH